MQTKVKGVPSNPTQKDMVYRATQDLARHQGILDQDEIVIAGLPATRAVENIETLVGADNFHKARYVGAEVNPDVYDEGSKLYAPYDNIDFHQAPLEDVLLNVARDVSIYNLDFCGAVVNRWFVEALAKGIEKSRSDGWVVIQLTRSPRKPADSIVAEDLLCEKLSNVNYCSHPRGYMGDCPMTNVRIVLEPKNVAVRPQLITPKSTSVKLTPREHQEEAVTAIVNEFEKASRAQCIMACGTGKTLVSGFVAERLQAKSIVVMVPSLGIITQFAQEMKNLFGASLACMAVCSDRTLDDEFKLDMVSTSNVNSIKNFIVANNGRRSIVFVTYHSSHILARMQTDFDLMIIDEAHRTAGEDLKRFDVALYDDKIKAAKRLSLTATQRVGGKRAMDNTALYGKVVYDLPYSKAVDRGIICPYDIVVTAVTAEDLFGLDPENIDPEEIGRIALGKSRDVLDVKRALLYTNRVADAKSFSDQGVPGFTCDYVDGTMPNKMRQEKFRVFKRAERSLLANVSCLKEGVDLPEADSVVFLKNKESIVEIVQITGRLARLYVGKQRGVVIIPVIVEDDGDGVHVEDEVILAAAKTMGCDKLARILLELRTANDSVQQHISTRSLVKNNRQPKGAGEPRTKISFVGFPSSLAEKNFKLKLSKIIAAQEVDDSVPTIRFDRNDSPADRTAIKAFLKEWSRLTGSHFDHQELFNYEVDQSRPPIWLDRKHDPLSEEAYHMGKTCDYKVLTTATWLYESRHSGKETVKKLITLYCWLNRRKMPDPIVRSLNVYRRRAWAKNVINVIPQEVAIDSLCLVAYGKNVASVKRAAELAANFTALMVKRFSISTLPPKDVT